MRKVLASALVSAILAVSVHAQQPALIPAHVRAAADRISAAQIAKDLEFLACDKLAGRNTPSPGFGILTIGFTTGVHARYHRPADEARFLDPKKIEAVARTVFVSLRVLADQSERPGIDKAIPDTVPRYGAR